MALVLVDCAHRKVIAPALLDRIDGDGHRCHRREDVAQVTPRLVSRRVRRVFLVQENLIALDFRVLTIDELLHGPRNDDARPDFVDEHDGTAGDLAPMRTHFVAAVVERWQSTGKPVTADKLVTITL